MKTNWHSCNAVLLGIKDDLVLVPELLELAEMRMSHATIGWRKTLGWYMGSLPCMMPFTVDNVQDVITPGDKDEVIRCIRNFAPTKRPSVSLYGTYDPQALSHNEYGSGKGRNDNGQGSAKSMKPKRSFSIVFRNPRKARNASGSTSGGESIHN